MKGDVLESIGFFCSEEERLMTATNRRVAAVDSCSLHAGFDFGFPHTSKHTLTSPLLSSRESKRKRKERGGVGSRSGSHHFSQISEWRGTEMKTSKAREEDTGAGRPA